MVKKQGGREMNPADAFRKSQRAKEIARNKKERKFQRDAHSMKSDPTKLKEELKEILDYEEDGKMNPTLRLKKRALQSAYDVALKKKREDVLRLKEGDLTFTNQSGHGVPERRPEDSVYYHPTVNPEGLPPPGKPQRYKTASHPQPASAATLPVPKPPPLPSGPAPDQGAVASQPAPLPPPPGPPPGVGESESWGPPDGFAAPVLPPPAFPPPGLPPPALPPPALPPPALPPPGMPPPGYHPLQPPPGPPPMLAGGLPVAQATAPTPSGQPSEVAAEGQRKDPRATITAAATVVKIPRAPQDKSVTSMVPPSLRIQRERLASSAARPRAHAPTSAAPVVGPGFGLAPTMAPRALSVQPEVKKPGAGAANGKSDVDLKYQEFLKDMQGLGAFAA